MSLPYQPSTMHDFPAEPLSPANLKDMPFRFPITPANQVPANADVPASFVHSEGMTLPARHQSPPLHLPPRHPQQYMRPPLNAALRRFSQPEVIPSPLSRPAAVPFSRLNTLTETSPMLPAQNVECYHGMRSPDAIEPECPNGMPRPHFQQFPPHLPQTYQQHHPQYHQQQQQQYLQQRQNYLEQQHPHQQQYMQQQFLHQQQIQQQQHSYLHPPYQHSNANPYLPNPQPHFPPIVDRGTLVAAQAAVDASTTMSIHSLAPSSTTFASRHMEPAAWRRRRLMEDQVYDAESRRADPTAQPTASASASNTLEQPRVSMPATLREWGRVGLPLATVAVCLLFPPGILVVVFGMWIWRGGVSHAAQGLLEQGRRITGVGYKRRRRFSDATASDAAEAVAAWEAGRRGVSELTSVTVVEDVGGQNRTDDDGIVDAPPLDDAAAFVDDCADMPTVDADAAALARRRRSDSAAIAAGASIADEDKDAISNPMLGIDWRRHLPPAMDAHRPQYLHHPARPLPVAAAATLGMGGGGVPFPHGAVMYEGEVVPGGLSNGPVVYEGVLAEAVPVAEAGVGHNEAFAAGVAVGMGMLPPLPPLTNGDAIPGLVGEEGLTEGALMDWVNQVRGDK
ncbi:hypothetical protein HK101_009591 [Irineochytrium annulatum]|nr:hypothetical protein HK101_009591 [Irineochytrium annulatum]